LDPFAIISRSSSCRGPGARDTPSSSKWPLTQVPHTLVGTTQVLPRLGRIPSRVPIPVPQVHTLTLLVATRPRTQRSASLRTLMLRQALRLAPRLAPSTVRRGSSAASGHSGPGTWFALSFFVVFLWGLLRGTRPVQPANKRSDFKFDFHSVLLYAVAGAPQAKH
jgi:hypothetical protein